MKEKAVTQFSSKKPTFTIVFKKKMAHELLFLSAAYFASWVTQSCQIPYELAPAIEL